MVKTAVLNFQVIIRSFLNGENGCIQFLSRFNLTRFRKSGPIPINDMQPIEFLVHKYAQCSETYERKSFRLYYFLSDIASRFRTQNSQKIWNSIFLRA